MLYLGLYGLEMLIQGTKPMGVDPSNRHGDKVEKRHGALVTRQDMKFIHLGKHRPSNGGLKFMFLVYKH